MALIEESWLFNSMIILAILFVAFIAWIEYRQRYWSRRQVYSPPKLFFFGNSYELFAQKSSIGVFALNMYNDIRKHNKVHGGIYLTGMATYMPIDPELIKTILQIDFNHFMDRGFYTNEEADPLSGNIFQLEGIKWQLMRQKMSSSFSPGKTKMMFEVLVKYSDQLIIEMDKTVGVAAPINIQEILVRFSIDVIGTCAFGIDCNTLVNPGSEFCHYAKVFFVGYKAFLALVAPNIMRKFGAKVINSKLSAFFMRIVKEIVDYREKNNVHRNDFMHLMLQLKNRGKLLDDDNIINEIDNKLVKLSLNQVAAQAFAFFIGGFETSSTTMTFCLFELATNLEMQDKLRKEVEAVLDRYDNQISYDAVMEMHYMEKVINETLRKYPPLPILNRVCTKEYKVPGTNLVLEKGTKVVIPVLGLHRNEEYYPDPEKFDPERFTEENKKKRHSYTYLPFGEGPRVCIGLRFGMIQTKVGLSVLLKNYRFTINEKSKVPLKMDPRGFILAAQGKIWLNYSKI